MADESIEQDVRDFAHRMFDLARAGDGGILGAYLDAGVPVDLTNENGDTLLILAAYHEHPDTVQVLLDRAADTNRTNDRGQTALAAATFKTSADGVRALVDAGADPMLGSPPAIEVARFFELPEILTLLEGGPA